jgi:hypothetical protein
MRQGDLPGAIVGDGAKVARHGVPDDR